MQSRGPINNNAQIPQSFICPLLVACFVPLLMLLWLVIFNDWGPAAINIFFRRDPTSSIYATLWTIFSLTIALLTTLLSFIDYRVRNDVTTPILGSALLAVALFDMFYLALLNQTILIGTNLEATLYFAWLIERLEYALFLFYGAAVFITVKSKNIRTLEQKNKWVYGISGSFIAISLLSVMAIFKSDHLPVLTFHINSRQYYLTEFIPFLVFSCWAIFLLPRLQKKFPSLFAKLLLLILIPVLLSQAVMCFSQEPFDIYFNIAHYFKLLSGIIPLLGNLFIYVDTIRNEKIIIDKLDNEIQARNLIEDHLKQREELLGYAESIAHMGSWEISMAHNAINWSDGLYEIYGFAEKNFQPTLQINEDTIAPEYREKVQKELNKAIRNKTYFVIEYQIIRPDKTRRYVLGQGSYMEKNQRLIGTVQDITELKVAMQKLAKNEALLLEAEAISHNGSWEWQHGTNTLYWSDEMFRIHGFEPNAFLTQLNLYKTFIHPEDKSYFLLSLKNAWEDHTPFALEYRIIRPDGEVRYVYTTGKFKTDPEKNTITSIGNTHDITELKKASILIDKSESIYRTIAHNVPDSAVFMYDRNLSLLLSEGPNIANLTSNIEIHPGQNLKEISSKQAYAHQKPIYEQVFSGNEIIEEQEINQRIYKTHYLPVTNSTGEVFSAMCVMQDITDIKKIQKDLEIKVIELKRSNRDLEQFAYTASHDLQEPLRKIRSFGERLQSSFTEKLNDERSDYIKRMQNAAERMQILIDDLLTFSQVTRTHGHLVNTNLKDIITAVLTDLEYAIEQKEAKIELDVKHNIEGDPGQLRQLFQNIISNALKFTAEGTQPHIQIQSTLDKGINFAIEGINPTGNYCIITVRDNGIGFDEQYANGIFDLFQRLHSRNEYQGTGIGLAICKKIVENHGGKIFAKSKEHEGATFYIILPSKQ